MCDLCSKDLDNRDKRKKERGHDQSFKGVRHDVSLITTVRCERSVSFCSTAFTASVPSAVAPGSSKSGLLENDWVKWSFVAILV